jgi:hypothetical protein
MKKKTFLFLYLVTQVAFSQDFKVLTSSGNNVLKVGNKRIWTGSSLKNTDVIVVAPNGYLGLMHLKTGKTVEIQRPGTYTMLNLTPKSTNSSITSKYGNYVAEEISKAERQDINKNHKKYMAVTGAVVRERGMNPTKMLTIVAIPNTNHEVYDSQVYLTWSPDTSVSKYYIRIENMLNNEVVALLETTKNVLEIDFASFKRAQNNEASFIVTISSAQDENYKGVMSLSLLDNTKKSLIDKELGKENPQNALDYLLRAKYFEEKKLFLDAVKCYNKAIALQNLDAYKNAYMEFLAKNNLGYQYNPTFKD